MLLHSFLVVLSLCGIEARSDWVRRIESPRTTNFGDWGKWEHCPEDSWVEGVNLKIESVQGRGDDTALNGIELTCVALNGTIVGKIKSNEGPWGYQRGIKHCKDGLMQGFELRSEQEQGRGDDAGAVDLKLICGDGQETIAGDILTWGQWTGKQYCPPRAAVCGISTQVEREQGNGDDTALNNVNMDCCRIPHPADVCTVQTVWRPLTTCSTGITSCIVSLISGEVTVTEVFTSQGWTTTKYQMNGFDMGVDYGLGTLIGRAKTLGNMGIETTLQKQISTLITENAVGEDPWSFATKCIGAVQQLYIICGPYEISTKEYRCQADKSKLLF